MSLTAGRLIKQSFVLLNRQTANRTAKLCNYHQFSRKPISSCLETSSYFKGLQHRAYCQVGEEQNIDNGASRQTPMCQDTLTTAKKLQAEGFSQNQAECLTKAMYDLLSNALDDSGKKLEGRVKIDIDSEKSRDIEAHADYQKDVKSLENKINVMNANEEKSFQLLVSKIDVEFSNMSMKLDKIRNDAILYLFVVFVYGVLTTMGILFFVKKTKILSSKHTTS